MSHILETNNELRCPNCRTKLDMATNVDGRLIAPSDGDVSVCAYCISPLTYRGKGMNISLYKMTDADLNELKLRSPDAHRQLILVLTVMHEKAQ